MKNKTIKKMMLGSYSFDQYKKLRNKLKRKIREDFDN